MEDRKLKLSVSEEAASRGQSLFIFAILISIILLFVLFALFNNFGIAFVITFFIFIVLLFAVNKLNYVLSSEEDKKVMDAIDTEIKEKSKNYENLTKNNPCLINAKYISGISELNKELIGTLVIEDDKLNLYDTVFREKNLSFEISRTQNIVYDESSKITLGRALFFGLGALVLKKNTYYLIIEYTSDNGINNQLVFDTGNQRNMEFFNFLNTARNKYAKPNGNAPIQVTEQLRELAKLKDEGILTEEEFANKKKVLLEKIH